MKKVLKVITGNEHGGAAESIRLLLDGILNDPRTDIRGLCLCQGGFARELQDKFGEKVIIFQSSVPPIIAAEKKITRLYNCIRLGFWFLKAAIHLAIYLLRGRVDVVHTTNNYALYVCCVCRIFLRFKLLSHWRCIGVRRHRLTDWLFSHVDQFICISKSVKKSLLPSWQLKSIVIYNGLKIPLLVQGGEQCRGKLRNYLGLDAETLLFGTVGSYTDIKCHDLLIETCRLLKPELQQSFRCVLIGSSPNRSSEKYLAYLKKKTEKYELTSEVLFLNDQELGIPAHIISDFDFFVGSTWFDGRGEGFGLMYVEAMAQGLPVIAIGVGAAVELIKPNMGLLVKDNSPLLHKDAILSISSDREKMRIMGRNSRKEAMKYDIHQTVHQIINLYQ